MCHVTEYSVAKTEEYPSDKIWILNTIASIWRETMLGYLSLDITRS